MSLKSMFLALGCILLVGLAWGVSAAITAAGPEGVSVIGLGSHVVFGLIVLGGLLLLWRRVSGALAELQKTVDCANSGDLTCRLETGLPGEFGHLQQSLARLLASFKDRLAFSQGVLHGICVPAAVFSKDNKTLFVNQAMLDLIGRSGTPEGHLGQRSGELIYNDAGRRTASQQAMEENRQIEKELDYTTPGGQSKHVRVVSTPYADLDGQVAGTVAFWIDLTELVAKSREAQAKSETLSQAAHGIEAVSESLSGTSEELASLVEESARGAVVQRDRVTETASAMEEMNATVLEVAKNASMAAEATARAKDKAQEGARAVTVSVEAIGQVETQAGVLTANMQRLNEQAARIGAIIDVISEIADQTNLLALNAAIEAARAGEAGRGFAVVADEVRKLAEKTMHATKEVGEAISGIQTATDDSARSVGETSSAIAKATELAQDSGRALTEIVELVESAADQVRSIATASEEQSAASEEINRAIEEVNVIAGETSEGMNHSERAVKELGRLSAELLGLIQVFGGREAARFEDSEHKMKGVLPKLMQEYVRESLGETVHGAMQKEMGKPVFLATGSYPDKVIGQMAAIAARHSGKPAARILHDFGSYTPGGFHRYYKKYFKTTDFREFLRSLNTIHKEVAKDMPGVEPPTFDIKESPEAFVITYHSKRGLHDYFEGVIKGAAKFLKAQATVELTPIDAQTSRATVRFKR